MSCLRCRNRILNLSRCTKLFLYIFFFFSSRRRHTRCLSDWSSDVCSSDLIPLPPATFEFLVFSLKMQAEMRLGLLKLGEGMEEELNLPAARHTIDMLAMIAEKTKGNLSLEIGRASCRERE